jgi:hypothetical protein
VQNVFVGTIADTGMPLRQENAAFSAEPDAGAGRNPRQYLQL